MTEEEERPDPTFGELIRGNVRVLGYVLVFMALAYGTWRGLVWLFPDVEWLRIR